MLKHQNKNFVRQMCIGLSKDFMTGMFILKLCGYTDEEKEYVRVNDKPLFKKIVVVNGRPKYVDIKIQEAIPISTDFEQLVVTNTKRKERRFISQQEIKQLLLLSGRISSLDDIVETKESSSFYIKKQ